MIQWQANKPKPDIHIRTAALEKFLSRFPDRKDIRLGLADQYVYLGEIQRAWDILSEANVDVQTDTEWLTAYGKLARVLGHDRIAKDCLTQAWQAGSRTSGVELSRLHSDAGDHDCAIELCNAILADDPNNHSAAHSLCKNLVAADQLDELWEWAQESSRHLKPRSLLLSAMAYACTVPTRTDLVRPLVAPGTNIVHKQGILGSELSENLRETLLSHKAQSDFPTIYAGKGTGKRIDGILEMGIPEVGLLFDRIQDAVAQYGLQISTDFDEHPANQYIGLPPRNASVESWANICVGDGHEDWHCHPAGWLSGVYYLDIPERATGPKSDTMSKAGQIEFGALPLAGHNDLAAWPKVSIKPENDMLLLFPSYFGHRTYPTLSETPRISIAFDVVPAA
jgi:tetratricopeptide (TPR) repeat protein